MDGIRRFELHPPQLGTQTGDQGMVDSTSFADALFALSVSWTVGAQGYRNGITGNGPCPLSERPSMRYDKRQVFGFNPGASWLCFCSDV